MRIQFKILLFIVAVGCSQPNKPEEQLVELSNLVVDAGIYMIENTDSLKLMVSFEFDIDPLGKKIIIDHYGKSIGDEQGIGGAVETLPHTEKFNWYDSYEIHYLKKYPDKFTQRVSIQGRVYITETDYKDFSKSIEKEISVDKMF